MKPLTIILILTLVISLALLGLSIYKSIGLQEDNRLLKLYPITCYNFAEIISDSCWMGCKYSTQFYSNQENTDKCMIYCIGTAKELQKEMCGVQG